MIEEIQKLIEDYLSWLRDRTILRRVNDDWVEITTPYLDRHNDYVQVYVRRDNGGFTLTDDGYTITDLSVSGCDLTTPKRTRLLQTTLNGFGVRLHGDALTVRASPGSFALRKHNLIQAMLAVNDLFALGSPVVVSIFREDVEAWLSANEVRYLPQVKFAGKTGYDHLFDFAIPSSNSIPERIIKAINQPSKNTAQSLAFAWLDTRNVRPADSQAYAFLNNSVTPVPPLVTDALMSYEIVPVPWSEREQVRDRLAA